MEIFIPVLSILFFGGMGLLLLRVGWVKIKAQNEQDTYGVSTSINSFVAIFQILIGCVGILIAVNQTIILIVKIIQALF